MESLAMWLRRHLHLGPDYEDARQTRALVAATSADVVRTRREREALAATMAGPRRRMDPAEALRLARERRGGG